MGDALKSWVATRARRLRRRRIRPLGWLGWLAVQPFLVFGLTVWALGGWDAMTFLAVAGLLIPANALGLFAIAEVTSLLVNPSRTRRILARTDKEGLVVQRGDHVVERVPWRDVALVWQPYPRGVEIFTYDGDELEILVPSPADANAIVDEVRAHYQRRAYRVHVEGSVFEAARKAVSWFLPLSFAGTLLALGPLALGGIPVAVVLGYFLARGHRRVELGADGIVVERGGRSRFVPYREIQKVTSSVGWTGGVARLWLTSGETIRIVSRGVRGRGALIEALVKEGMEMAERGKAAGAEVPDLVRHESSTRAFADRLSALTKPGYRNKTLSADELFSLMRNPAVDRDQRAAAALALRNDPAALPRIRVAAEVTAEPEVRAALDALGEEEINPANLDRILDRLSRRAHPG
jgi:hypothetical protein